MNDKIRELNEQLKPSYIGISASSLNWFDVSPLYFKKKLDREIEEPESKAAELGNQLHMFLLEPQKFNEKYLYLNFEKPRSENQKEFCKACANMRSMDNNLKMIDIAVPCYKTIYNATKKSEEKIKDEAKSLYIRLEPYITYLVEKDKYRGIISGSTLSYLREARQRVKNHDLAASLLYDDSDLIDNPNVFSANELRVYWEHPYLTLEDKPLVLKSIIDRLYIDHKSKVIKLIDVKTSGKLYMFDEKFRDYNYKRQMGFYWYAVEYMFKQLFLEKDITEYAKETYIVGVQTPEPYMLLPTECKVAYVDDKTVTDGKSEVNKQLSDIIWHFESDEWQHSMNFYLNNGIDLVV